MTRNRFDDCEGSIFQVTSLQKENLNWGTAFIIDRDDTYCYLLTCKHVVDRVGGEENVAVLDARAEVQKLLPHMDAAVLRTSAAIKGPAIPLHSKRRLRGWFCSRGFSKLGPGYRLRPLYGNFGRVFPYHLDRQSGGHPAWELHPRGSDAFERGLSGSPVFTPAGECVAMVALREDTSGIAYSIDLVREAWPNAILKSGDDELAYPAERRSAADRRSTVPRFDRDDEIDTFMRVMSGKDTMTKAIVIESPSGFGKTRLLAEYEEIARMHDFPVLKRNFKEYTTVDDFLQSIEDHFGGRGEFKEFNSYKDGPRSCPEDEHCRLLARSFMRDLDKLSLDFRLLLIMDQFDKADIVLRDWLSKHFLGDIVRKDPHLTAVVAGQVKPTLDYDAEWIQRFSLGRISLECWSAFLQRHGICISEDEVAKTYDDCDGMPLCLGVVFLSLERDSAKKAAAT